MFSLPATAIGPAAIPPSIPCDLAEVRHPEHGRTLPEDTLVIMTFVKTFRSLDLLPYALTAIAVRYLPPRGRGMRLVGTVHRIFPPPSNKLLEARLWCGCRLTVDLHDAVQASLYYRGFHEPSVTAVLRRHLRAGDCFVDVGANVGYYSCVASCLVGRAGSVHAIEPSTKLIDRFRMDLARNRISDRIVLHPVAVSDFEGTAYLQRGSHDPTPDGDRFITVEQFDGPSAELVPVTTLDSLLIHASRVDVLKLDIEGQELSALRGAVSTIRRFRPRLILVEDDPQLLKRSASSSDELWHLLTSLGYQGHRIETGFDAPMVQFQPDDRN